MKNSLLPIIFTLTVTVLFYKTYNNIINYPTLIIFSFTVIIVFILFITKKLFKTIKLKWASGINYIPIFFICFICLGSIFNIINYRYSNKQSIKYEVCRITKVGCIRRHNGVYFIFKEKEKYFKCISSEIDDMCENNNFEDYKVEVKYKKGLLGSWFIYDYSFT